MDPIYTSVLSFQFLTELIEKLVKGHLQLYPPKLKLKVWHHLDLEQTVKIALGALKDYLFLVERGQIYMPNPP